VPRVLIADDNEGVRHALRSLFGHVDDGWSVCGEAVNGLDAIQLVDKLKPDVVLLDFQMPVMNGLEAAREITKTNPLVPIAMYTLHQNPIFQKQAEAYGVRKVISKSDVFAALIPSLAAMLEGNTIS
jgi:pilus assembly protein CpaE